MSGVNTHKITVTQTIYVHNQPSTAAAVGVAMSQFPIHNGYSRLDITAVWVAPEELDKED